VPVSESRGSGASASVIDYRSEPRRLEHRDPRNKTVDLSGRRAPDRRGRRRLAERVPWAAVATLLVSAGAGYRYLFTPRPVTGVVPTDELAVLVRDDEDIRRHDRDRTNARTFRVDDGCVDVPVVVQNSGSRAISEYKFTITFADDGADDDHVQTEPMTVDGLFCDPECYTSDDRITESYDRLGMPGQFVSLNGSLGSGTMEIVVLELSCPASLDCFSLRIGVDSSEWFLGETTHCQYVSLDRERS
jgi:hypothetical protein